MNTIYEAQQKRKRHLEYICDAILSQGKIIKKEEHQDADVAVKSFLVIFSDSEYELVKNNNEWVSFNCLGEIKGGGLSDYDVR